MKRTLKRELKVREIAERETLGISVVVVKSADWATGWCTFVSTGQRRFSPWDRMGWERGCLQCYSPAPCLAQDRGAASLLMRTLTKWC